MNGDSVMTRSDASASERARVERPRSPKDVDESIAIDPDLPGAYQWWYFDATSEDGAHALVVIVFIGSVFSPWYFSRLAAGERALPREHCAINVALSSKAFGAPSRWVFSEYRGFIGDPSRGMSVGRSSLVRERDGAYELWLDDRAPTYSLPRSLKGRVRFVLDGPTGVSEAGPYLLDPRGRHRWAPVAPRCRVDAEFSEPSLRFRGVGYHDLNHGDEPLGAAFARWHWARAHEPGRSRVRYDRTLRDGARRVLEVDCAANELRSCDRVAREPMRLRVGGWALMEPAALQLDDRTTLVDVRRVESSPFYARYTARTAAGDPAVAEHLDLERFASPSMQRMLPFRARRS